MAPLPTAGLCGTVSKTPHVRLHPLFLYAQLTHLDALMQSLEQGSERQMNVMMLHKDCKTPIYAL